MDKLLAGWEKVNEYKHGKDCCDQRMFFSPFFLLLDGMMGNQELVVLSTLS